MEPGDGHCRSCVLWSSVLLLIKWGQQCLAAEKGSCETWSTDSWPLTDPVAAILDVIMLEYLSHLGKVGLC